MIYSKLVKIEKRGKNGVKTRQKAEERKIFILAIFFFQTFKSWVSCVCKIGKKDRFRLKPQIDKIKIGKRLRRNTARRVLRYFPRAPQILQRTRIADAMTLRAPRCRLCAFAGAKWVWPQPPPPLHPAKAVAGPHPRGALPQF